MDVLHMSITNFSFSVQMPGASVRLYPFNTALDYDIDDDTVRLVGKWKGAFKRFEVTARDINTVIDNMGKKEMKTDTVIDIVLTNNDIYQLYTRSEPIVKLLELIHKKGEEPDVTITNLSKETGEDNVNVSMHITIMTTKINSYAAVFHFINFDGEIYKSGCSGEQRQIALKSVDTFISRLLAFNTF